jgi:signal-transduction protein with cAMP-binding, CBS, and nucleotidyltransferase domain
MTAGTVPYAHKTHLLVASLLGLAGLATALAWMLFSHPYTMLIFLMFGQVLIVMGISLFVYVVVRDIRSRMETLVEKTYAPGEIIFRRGDSADRLYVINEGEVEVIQGGEGENETILARLGTGEYFGEMALLSNAPRNATIRAATDLEVLTIHRDDFTSLHGSIPALRQSLEEAMERRTAKE